MLLLTSPSRMVDRRPSSVVSLFQHLVFFRCPFSPSRAPSASYLAVQIPDVLLVRLQHTRRPTPRQTSSADLLLVRQRTTP